MGAKPTQQGHHAIFLHVSPSLSGKEISGLYENLLVYPFYDIGPAIGLRTASELTEDLLICSLKRVPVSRVMAALPNFRVGQEYCHFTWTTDQIIPVSNIRGYSKAYVERDRVQVRDLKKPFQQRNVTYERDPTSRWTGFYTEAHSHDRKISVHNVVRKVNLWVLSGIESEEDANSLVSSILRKTESKKI